MAATAEHMRRAAIRAVDDPVTLRKSARVIRAALARKRLALADLEGDIVGPADLPRHNPEGEVANDA